MKPSITDRRSIVNGCRGLARLAGAALLIATGAAHAATATLDLADKPLFSTVTVPGNVLLALSVEFPTALSPAYPNSTAYSASSTFIGYFDSEKCYKYSAINTGTTASPDYSTSYFVAYGAATNHVCTTTSSNPLWSGNYLNWASMGALDTFRMVMTGGYRATDTTSSTILEKAYNYNTGVPQPRNTPDKTITTATTISGATPFTWTSATSKVWHQGTAMLITGTNTTYSTSTTSTCYASTTCVNVGSPSSPYAPLTPDSSTSYYYNAQSSVAGTATASKIYKLYIRVKVCDTTVSVESNCVLYSANSNYKPEGLMHSYSSKLRFSAFGYLNIPDYGTSTANIKRDGGVMRSKMKYIGPTQPVPGSTAITNSLAEWSSSTGVMVTNPDSSDATNTISTFGLSSSDVTNSGAMNYLNKFGQTSHDYKTYDPVSELYYAALRYYKGTGYGNVSTYTSGTTAAYSDGFPVITSWDDPIVYSCQKNFILGIGDTNTGPDRNLEDATNKSSYETSTTPSTITSAGVTAATNMVGTLEGISGLAAKLPNSSTNSYYIAGLAYDAHTVDIRSDLTGTQTVNTYWLDVWEYQTYASKNQYWLAAKYGGFTLPSDFSPYAAGNSSSTLATTDWYNSTDTVGSDKRPDNYFAANQADKMKTGLTSAFAKISSEADAATSTALSTTSPNVTSSGSISYSATYDPSTWTGKVIASAVAYASDGTPTLTTKWDARALLNASTVTASTRKIVTCCTGGGAALPFTTTALAAATLSSRTYYASFAAVPGVATASQSAANYLAYLRGDSTNEVVNGGPYRTRTYRLGDIVNAKPVAVGAPDSLYYDYYNPGYSSFKASYAGRATVVYAGANDGMLHAFDGTVGGTTSGSELFAYIPSFVYGSSSTASTTGISTLGNPSFTHHYFVDATPGRFDLNLNNTYGSSSSTTDWRTLLIGGLGKGGNGYYAIDVTDPTSWTSEAAVAAKVLWEFTDSRMGYSYGVPSVVKTKKYGWVVVFTSGYNNSDGVGYFFFVNPSTGALLEAVATPSGSTSAPINLAHHTAFIPDYHDMTADAIYAGDMQGNLWRLDVTGTGAYSAPTLIATLANASGKAQPVTTRPLVEIDPDSSARYLMVGTGSLLSDTDITTSSVQTFYAIVDGTGTSGGFYTSSTLPSGVSFPITRGALNANTSLLTGIGSSPGSAMGWYFDLPVTNSIAQRVDVDATANQGIVAFIGNLPNDSACSPSGTGTLYAVAFTTGKTVLTDSSSALIASSSPISGILTDVVIQRVNGKLRLYAGGSTGDVVNAPANLSTAGGVKQINWREVPLAD